MPVALSGLFLLATPLPWRCDPRVGSSVKRSCPDHHVDLSPSEERHPHRIVWSWTNELDGRCAVAGARMPLEPCMRPPRIRLALIRFDLHSTICSATRQMRVVLTCVPYRSLPCEAYDLSITGSCPRVPPGSCLPGFCRARPRSRPASPARFRRRPQRP